MTHRSENVQRLRVTTKRVLDVEQIAVSSSPAVHLFWLPDCCIVDSKPEAHEVLHRLLHKAAQLNGDSVVCILGTAADIASCIGVLPKALHYQLWVAVKRKLARRGAGSELPEQHCSLLVLSRYAGSLRHNKTRVAYTYCPGCGKTTKDYGGKKHTYHPYGTLLSDVWRDVECNPCEDVGSITDRLRDLFGLEPFRLLVVHDMRSIFDLNNDQVSLAGCGAVVAHRREGRAIRLINEDCIKAMQSLDSDSVDYCFADPPYNIKKTYDRWDDGIEVQEYFEWCDRWIDELCRVLRAGCSMTLINIPLWCARHFQHLSKSNSGMRFQSWIAWDGLSLPVRMIMPSHYGIVTFSKGPARPAPGLVRPVGMDPVSDLAIAPSPEFFCVRASCQSRNLAKRARAVQPLTDLWHDIHRLKHNSKRVDHPCQLPPTLMRRLLGLYTWAGETVLDPFDGAGTTSLVSAQMKRSAIGIELSSEYHAIAQKRHADLKSGADPFAAQDRVPKAKNSRVQRMPKRRYAVPKKHLQLEVREIAQRLGRLPTRAEVASMSEYPIKYFDEYFVSWGEVCASARNGGMSEDPRRKASSLPLFDPIG